MPLIGKTSCRAQRAAAATVDEVRRRSAAAPSPGVLAISALVASATWAAATMLVGAPLHRYVAIGLLLVPQLVIALVVATPRRWPTYLACFVAITVVLVGVLPGVATELTTLSAVVTAMFAAAMSRTDCAGTGIGAQSTRSVRRFVLWAVFVAPATSLPLALIGLVCAGSKPHHLGSDVHALAVWYLSQAVGMAFLVPVVLRWRRWWGRCGVTQLVLGLSAAVMTVALCTVGALESSFILLFLSGLPAMVVLFRAGLSNAFVQMMIVAGMTIWFAIKGYGPFNSPTTPAGTALINALCFVLGGYAMLIMVAVALAERSRLSALDKASHKVYDLMAEVTGDVVILADPDGNVLHCAQGVPEALHLPDRLGSPDWLRAPRAPHGTHVQESADAPAPMASVPFRLRSRDGGWAWFVSYTRRTADGLFVSILRDVTRDRAAHESLTNLVNTDALTGLANRRGLSRGAAAIWRRAAETGRDVAALFIDIDHFKAFNDRYGHQAGDDCLRRVAGVLGAESVDHDTCVSRYGGEEFAVVAQASTDPIRYGAQVRSAVEALAIPHAGSDSGLVTVSIGIATVSPRRGDAGTSADTDASVATLLDRADRALYAAKAQGRNAIAVAPAHAYDVDGTPNR